MCRSLTSAQLGQKETSTTEYTRADHCGRRSLMGGAALLHFTFFA